jgi:hypothetical protein
LLLVKGEKPANFRYRLPTYLKCTQKFTSENQIQRKMDGAKSENDVK